MSSNKTAEYLQELRKLPHPKKNHTRQFYIYSAQNGLLHLDICYSWTVLKVLVKAVNKA